MSYLKDIKESLKNIDELCDDALKDGDETSTHWFTFIKGEGRK